MGITKGYTFGATELVTNTKLHTLVDSATISQATASAIGGDVPSTGAFTSLTATGSLIASSILNNLTATGMSAASGNFDGTLRCDIFRLDQTPLTATASAQQTAFTCDDLFTISLNGVTFYVPCASASA